MTIRIDDALVTSQIAIPLRERWVETAIPVEFSSRMRASEVGSGDVALISSAEATMLTTSHVIAPEVAVVMNGVGPIAMRTPVRPDEVEETLVRLYESGATAEMLMRALLRSYFGITAARFAWIDEEQGADEALVVIVDDALGLSQPESGYQEDLTRAWFILTGQAVVSHVTVIGLEVQARGADEELNVLRAAVAAGVERRREVRGLVAERTGVDRDRLAEVTNRLRFELTREDRISLANLAARGSWSSRFGRTIPVFRDALPDGDKNAAPGTRL